MRPGGIITIEPPTFIDATTIDDEDRRFVLGASQ
jgi:hypothetical protein